MPDMMKTVFHKFFNIYPEEFGLVQFFFVYYLLVGIFYTLAVTAGDALFLANVDHEHVEGILAWVYVGVAVSSVVTIWIYDAVSGWVSRKTLFLGIHFFLIGGILLFRVCMNTQTLVPEDWLYFGLVVWLEMCGILSITLFFSMAGDYFTSHSAKRLYGYIAGGLSIGNIIGGAVIGPLLDVMTCEDLLYVCAGLIGAFILFELIILKYSCTVDTGSDTVKTAPRETAANYSRFIRYIYLSVFLAMVCYVMVDFQMKLTARSFFPDADDLNRFFGVCYTVMGLIQVPFQLIVVMVLLKRLGIINCLMILPFLHIIMAACFYATGHGFFPGQALLIIVTANYMRMMISETLEIPSRELLFLPLPTEIRQRAQARMGGMVMPFCQGVAGLFVMALTWIGLARHEFSLVVIGSAAVWILIFVVKIRHWYQASLISSLQHFRLDESQVRTVVNQAETLPVLHTLLNSNQPHVIGFTLDLLADRDRLDTDMMQKIIRLTGHSHEWVCAAAIKLIGKKGNEAHVQTLVPHTRSGCVPIRRAAITAVCTLKKENALNLAGQWMDSKDDGDRQAALAGISKVCTPRSGQIIIDHIQSLFTSKDRDRICSAVKACGQMQLAQFVPDMIRLFEKNVLRPEIASSLARMPRHCLPVIQQQMTTPQMDDDGRSLMFHAASSMGGLDAVDGLWHIFDQEDSVILRVSAGEALQKIKYSNPSFKLSSEQSDKIFNRLCRKIGLLNSGIREINGTDGLVKTLLSDHAGLELNCLFQLLALTDPIREMEWIKTGFFSDHPVKRANAAESIDNMLSRDRARLVMPLLEPFITPFSGKTGTGFSKKTADQLLKSDAWTRQLVLYHQKKQDKNAAPLASHTENRTKNNVENLEQLMILKQVPLFNRVPANYLIPLSQKAVPVLLASGQVLFKQGDIGHSLYIICRGKVQVSAGDKVLNTTRPFQSIGEMSLLDAMPMPRSATCTAMADTRLMKIPAADFQSVIQTHTRASFAVLQTLAGRLRKRTATLDPAGTN